MVEDIKMNKKINNGRRSIVFARGVVGPNENKIADQIKLARRFCRSQGLRVVGAMKLENCSANDRAIEAALEALLARKDRQDDYDVLVTPDLSRLTRKGICHATS